MIATLLTLFIAYILLFLLSLRLKDNSIADVFWGLGFIILAVGSFLSSPQEKIHYLVTGLVLLWGIRLTLHIGVRKWKERKEDPRYAKWREEWGSGWYFYARSFLQVYMLQMVLMLVVALPIFFVNFSNIIPQLEVWKALNPEHFGATARYENYWIAIGPRLALFGLLFEIIADYQLKQFIKTKKPGQIFTTGLYKYSRHPNYFGESMFWLGISITALQYSPFALIGWIVITFLLLFVSGVPLQEARYAGRPEWEEYKRKTSVFFPWIPKK